MLRSEREHEQTHRALEELLSNTILAQDASTIPRPNTSNSVHDAQLRTAEELTSKSAGIEPNDEVVMLKTIPPEWARHRLESTRDLMQDNDVGC